MCALGARYRKRHADEDADENKAGVAPRDGVHEGDGGEFTAVAAVTAAAKAVEEELRGQLEARDQALRQARLFGTPVLCLRRSIALAQILCADDNGGCFARGHMLIFWGVGSTVWCAYRTALAGLRCKRYY